MKKIFINDANDQSNDTSMETGIERLDFVHITFDNGRLIVSANGKPFIHKFVSDSFNIHIGENSK